MADITLRRNVFGDGYSGSLTVPAGLSWMDSMAIQNAAHSAQETSAEITRARQALDRIGYDVGDLADSISQLEGTIGLKLDEQTHVLEQQSQMLEEIRGAVINPSKTRAAERIADAAQLLSHDRFERALTVANEAIDADPNNPNGFFAAGWALVGLERFDEAREMFEEARDASHGDQRSLGSRQSARSAFLAGKPDLAYTLVRDARKTAESADEKGAVAYDVAVYAVPAGDTRTAIDSIQAAARQDSRHAERALIDLAFEQAADVRDAAATVLAELAEQIAERRPPIEHSIRSLRSSVPSPPTDRRAHTDLSVGVRPNNDWSQIHASMEQRLADAERSLDQATSINLQSLASALDSAEKDIEELSTVETPRLEQAIAAHDEAAQREDELGSMREQLQRDRKRTEPWIQLQGFTNRHRTGLFWWGVIFGLIGLLVMPLLVAGVACLALLAVGYIGGSIAQRYRQTQDRKMEQIDNELKGRR